VSARWHGWLLVQAKVLGALTDHHHVIIMMSVVVR
jgi:hypothetical protein